MAIEGGETRSRDAAGFAELNILETMPGTLKALEPYEHRPRLLRENWKCLTMMLRCAQGYDA